jgi:hypothetical protein
MSPLIIDFPFGISVDLSFWTNIFSWAVSDQIKAIFALGGWTILALVFFYMGAHFWLEYRQKQYTAKWKWVLLAVDIPEETIQSPKAVEQIFAHFSGALINTNFGEKYWHGEKQKWFSLEIISIEGYIQFLIYTEAGFRDLVEAAIYAQYPTAEITEVEDYVDSVPGVYPNDTHDFFGLEFGLASNEAYPIRTYEEFEYSISKDVVFTDPMASLLENFSRIKAGENIWFQIVAVPTDNSWKEKGIELAKKLVEHGGAEHGAVKNDSIISKFGGIPQKIGQELLNIWHWEFEGEEKSVAETPLPGKVSDLRPGVKNVIESIENKISHVGFKTKIRYLYSARKEVYSPAKHFKAFVGSINQFFNSTRNGLAPVSSTQAHYAFAKYRESLIKNKFLKAYKKRKLKTGANPFILNTVEMATLWHFPLPFVKTPQLQKAMSKRVEPPIDLPVETFDDLPVEETVEEIKDPNLVDFPYGLG